LAALTTIQVAETLDFGSKKANLERREKEKTKKGPSEKFHIKKPFRAQLR